MSWSAFESSLPVKTSYVATLEVCSFLSELFSLEPFHIPAVGPQAGSFIFTVGFTSEFKTNLTCMQMVLALLLFL